VFKFSIIMPVRAINDYVKESVSHIKRLDYSNYEVFIITDEDDRFGFNDPKINIIVSGKVGPGEKRNLGAKLATGDVLAFLDDDSYPRNDWLKNASDIFKDDNVFALGGTAITPEDADYLERMSGYLFESFIVSGKTTYRYKPEEKRLINDYPSVNLFVRKSSFEEVGGFPVEFWPGEDTKLCLDLVERYKNNFPYDPEVLVYHHRRKIFKPHLKQISRYGRHRGQFARIFPKTSRVPMYFAPSIFSLLLFSGLAMSLIFPIFYPLYFGGLLTYIGLLLFASYRVLRNKEKNTRAYFDFISGAFLTHIYYGINFLIGIMKKPKLKLKKYDEKTGNYVEG